MKDNPNPQTHGNRNDVACQMDLQISYNHHPEIPKKSDVRNGEEASKGNTERIGTKKGDKNIGRRGDARSCTSGSKYSSEI